MSEEKEILSPALADARERLRAANAALDEKRKVEKTARLEQEANDAAALAEAILKHGEIGDGIARVNTKAGIVIVKRPTEGRWRQATKDAESRDSARLEESSKLLIMDHLVYPSEAAYFTIAARYPAMPATLIELIAGLARGGARALTGE